MEPSNFIWRWGRRTMGAAVDTVKTKSTKDKKGTKTVLKSPEITNTPAFENPLVPHAVLREMYTKLVEFRLLETHARRLVRGRKSVAVGKTHGQEACRVSLTQGLGAGDLVMESQPGGLTGYLLGALLADVLAGARPQKSKKKASAAAVATSRLLPFVANAEARLYAGLGVALLAQQMRRNDGVVIFVDHNEASGRVWRRVLTLAAKQTLPVIFVVLAKLDAAKLKDEVSAIAHKCGVPGIAVDASDTVALYRVAQESMGRIRNGGGAVVIEGISFAAAKAKSKVAAEDPIALLRGYMKHRQISPERWMAKVEKSFLKRLRLSS
jgi:TPP-dependent pyruvate/acetoin dehydrogenase alpha subunit